MAYPNKTTNEGPNSSFMADPGEAAIGAFLRCKFVETAAGETPDNKPMIQVCSATERADVVTLQPIAAGAYGACKYANAAGEFWGIILNTCASGVNLYGAAAGKVTSTSGGGAVLVGKSTSSGNNKGVTYAPAAAAA